jgi:hypothetical protein
MRQGLAPADGFDASRHVQLLKWRCVQMPAKGKMGQQAAFLAKRMLIEMAKRLSYQDCGNARTDRAEQMEAVLDRMKGMLAEVKRKAKPFCKPQAQYDAEIEAALREFST